MTFPGFTAEFSLPDESVFHSPYTHDAKGKHPSANNVVTPAWWSWGACGLGLCLIHCFEDEAARQSRCIVYELPF
jgi:hypothetical protein